MKEYLELFNKNVKFTNKDYYNNVFSKGLNTINHLFNIILLYTKNLKLAFNYGQKSVFYYIEFIDQISEDANSFLQLNSHDAVLFVYKKTIFEIDNKFKTDFILKSSCEINKFNIIKKYCDLIEKIISFYLKNKLEKTTIDTYVSKLIKRINSSSFNTSNIDKLNILVDNLSLTDI